MSIDANRWAKHVDAPCSTSKQVLRELADWASVDGRAYPLVSSIAKVTQKSDRTVIRMLNKLEAAGLIQHESWITPPGSDFRRPVYRLAMPEVPAFAPDPGLKRRGGDQAKRKAVAKQGVVDVTFEGAADVTCEGVAGVTCEGDTLSPKTVNLNHSEAIASSTGGRALADANGVRQIAATIYALWPDFGRKTSSPKATEAAVTVALSEGITGEALIAAARSYAADRSAWGASGKPKACDAWIAAGRWAAFVPTVGAAANAAGLGEGAVGRPAWNGPAKVRAVVVAERGEDFAGSYLDPAEWRPVDRAVITHTGIAADAIRKLGRTALERAGIARVVRKGEAA